MNSFEVDLANAYRRGYQDGQARGGPLARAMPEAKPHAERHALAQLRQWVWEASQYKTYDEIREYVEAVLREIQSDEP